MHPRPSIRGWWYCCECGDGPRDVDLYDRCSNCPHFRCESCRTEGDNDGSNKFRPPNIPASLGAAAAIQKRPPPVNARLMGMYSTPTRLANRQIDPQLPAPDRFIQDPGDYLGSVNMLQQKLFDLGEFALERLKSEDGCYWLPLPPSPPSAEHLQAEHMRRLFLDNLQLAAAIIEGQNLPLKSSFCHERYNIIVADDRRNNVLKVISVDPRRIQLLSTLLKEAISQCGAFLELKPLEEISKDIDQVIRLILHELDLSRSLIYSPMISIWEKRFHICHATSYTLIVLFLGMVSFVSSHACIGKFMEKAAPLETLYIETDTGFISMAPRRLSCLDGFTKSSLWGFSASSRSNLGFEARGSTLYQLSCFLVDFSELWGPLGLRYTENSLNLIDQVTVKGGTITATSTSPSRLDLEANEVLCHWDSWGESGINGEGMNRCPFSVTKRLVIGAGSGTQYSPSSTFHFLDQCEGKCGRGTPYSDSFSSFELQTQIPSWKLAERTAQLSGGAYVNLLYGHTWKFNSGWTLKDIIINDWVEQVRNDITHAPIPFYLDYLTTLEISRCTGNSRRLSIWELLKQAALKSYMYMILDRKTADDFHILLEYFPRAASAKEVWQSVSDAGRDVLKITIKTLLSILRSTGLGEDGKLQVWDITSRERIDGRKISQNWETMVKDDLACATFAIITSSCIRSSVFERDLKTGMNGTTKIAHGVLSTLICITASEPLPVDQAQDPKLSEKPLEEIDNRPSWALTNQDFTDWKVKLAARERASGPDPRRKIIESVREPRLSDIEGLDEIERRHTVREIRRQQNSSLLSRMKNSKKPEWKTFWDKYYRKFKTQQMNLDEGVAEEPLDPADLKSKLNVVQKSAFSWQSFRFKNGMGEEVGSLTLKPCPGINNDNTLPTISDSCGVPAEWLQRSSGASIISKLKSKEETLETQLSSCREKESKGLLPWAIKRFIPDETSTPTAAEHIRGGELTKYQKVIRMHIR